MCRLSSRDVKCDYVLDEVAKLKLAECERQCECELGQHWQHCQALANKEYKRRTILFAVFSLYGLVHKNRTNNRKFIDKTFMND